MFLSFKTKIFNKSLFIFLFLAIFSFGFLALADEQEVVTTFLDDIDQDGLTADEEKAYGTDPTNSDTDGDSYSDGVEIESGYDPLLPAPGDRIVPENEETESATATSETTEPKTVNLTELATEELANVVDEKGSQNQEITNEDLNQAVANVLAQANQEVELPEVDVDKIKIKELEAKLSESEKENKKKEDTLQYLTTVSYIILSNAPAPIRSDMELASFIERASQEALLSVVTGNFNLLDTLEKKSETILTELESIEVPENMVSTHLKAVQIVKLFGSMGSKIKSVDLSNDPIGQMAEFSKIQGAVFEVQNFVYETQQSLTALGIKNIPLDI